MAVPSSTALIVQAPLRDTLWQAHLLCWVCEREPWTQAGEWHPTLICAGCAENEPNPHEESDDAKQFIACDNEFLCGVCGGPDHPGSAADLFGEHSPRCSRLTPPRPTHEESDDGV